MGSAALSKSVVWASFEAVSLIGLSFATLLILARWIGPAEFGRAATVLAIIQLMSILVEQIFAEVLVQRSELRSEHINSAFSVSVLVAFIFIVACAITSLFDRLSEFGLLLCVASLGLLPAAYLSIQGALLRRSFEFRALALRTVLGRLMGAAVALMLAARGAGAWSIIAQNLAMSFVGAMVIWYFAPSKLAMRISGDALRDLRGFGLVSLASEASVVSAPKIYQLIASYLFGVHAFGQLSVALRLVDTLKELIGHLASNIGLPLFSRLQHDRAALQGEFKFATAMVCLIALPLFVGLSVCADLVVHVVLGKDWLETIPLVQILAVGAAFSALAYFCYSVFSACGKPSMGLVPRGIFDWGFTPICLIVFSGYGITAAAAVWAMSAILNSTMALWLCLRLLSMSPAVMVRTLSWPLVVSACIAVCLWVAGSRVGQVFDSAILELIALVSLAAVILTIAVSITYRDYIYSMAKQQQFRN